MVWSSIFLPLGLLFCKHSMLTLDMVTDIFTYNFKTNRPLQISHCCSCGMEGISFTYGAVGTRCPTIPWQSSRGGAERVSWVGH